MAILIIFLAVLSICRGQGNSDLVINQHTLPLEWGEMAKCLKL